MYRYLVEVGIQYEFGTYAIVFWAAAIEEWIGQVGEPFRAQSLATKEKYSILQWSTSKNDHLHPEIDIINNTVYVSIVWCK